MIRKTLIRLYGWYVFYSLAGVFLGSGALLAVTELSTDLIYEPGALAQFLGLFNTLLLVHAFLSWRWVRPAIRFEEAAQENEPDRIPPEQAREMIGCLNRLIVNTNAWILFAWPVGGVGTAAIYGFRETYSIGWLEKIMTFFISVSIGVMISIYIRALSERRLEPVFQYFRAKGGLATDDSAFQPRLQTMRWTIGWPVVWLLVILVGFGILFGFAQGEKTVRSTMERLAVFRLSSWHEALESSGTDASQIPDYVNQLGTQMALFKPSPHGAVVWFDSSGAVVGLAAEDSEKQFRETPLHHDERQRIVKPELAGKNMLRSLPMESVTGSEQTGRQVDYRRMLSRKLDLWVWMPLTHGGAIAMVFPRQDIEQETGTMGLAAVLFLITGLLLWRVILFAAEGITRPLSRLTTSLEGIAGGDLSVPVNVAAYNEVGRVSRSVQLMRDGLRALVGRIGQSSTQLGEISTRVSHSSSEVQQSTQEQVKAVEVASASIEQIGRSLGEVSRTVGGLSEEARAAISEVEEVKEGATAVEKAVDSLSERIEETNSSIFQVAASIRSVVDNVDTLSMAANETASNVREMEQSILSVRDLATDSVETAARVLSDAESGARAVQENLHTMETIRETSLRATSTMQKLSDSLDEIREIVQVIQDVASKTNLLSLNAAIIAAQAGDEGAGFSVVATQIKQLAGRTQRSAKEIGERIQGILQEAQVAVHLVLQGDQQIERGVNVSAEARAALEQIQFSTLEISERVKRIAKATGEQSNGATEITRSISRTVEMIDSIARATDEQKRGADQITKASESMQETADRVLDTTTEQKRLTSRIAERIARIAQLVDNIDRAAREQGAGAKEISWAASSISESSRHNLDRVLELNEVIQLLASEARTLEATVRNFRV